jgi:hypothetical protein
MAQNHPHQGGADSLSPAQLEFLKLEIGLLEQRILHLENLQYRLRQFSMALWVATLGVGLGLTSGAVASPFLIAISGLVPTVFMYLDAWYATNAQSFRCRRNEITYFLNFTPYLAPRTREQLTDGKAASTREPDTFYVLDLVGDLTLKHSKAVAYRRSLVVKLTRTARLCFYGLQVLGSSVALGQHLATEYSSPSFWALGLLFPAAVVCLRVWRQYRKSRVLSELGTWAKTQATERADVEHYADFGTEALDTSGFR